MRIARYMDNSTDGVLVFEPDDFDIEGWDTARKYVEKTRGYRFSFCLIPGAFRNTYYKSPVFGCIEGVLMIGQTMKSKILFY